MASATDSIPSDVPSEDYQSFINAQRQQQLAQALMSSSMSPIQQPETAPVKGLYVQPRVGALQGVSKIAEALMGRGAANRALQSQIALQRQVNQAWGSQVTSPGTPLQAALPPADPNEQSVQPAIARLPGASLGQTVQASQPQMGPNPRNPWGLPADVARNMARTDPAAYAKYLQGPDSVQLGRIAGVDPATAARAALQKQTAIDLRPGSTLIDPLSGQQSVAADPSRGEQYARLPDGTLVAVPIGNSAAIQGDRAGLVTANQEYNKLRELPQGGGVTKLGYGPMPPALQALQGGGAGAPQPSGAPAGAAPGPGAAVGGSAGAAPQPSGAAAPPSMPRSSPAAPGAAPPGSAGPVPVAVQGDQRLWAGMPKLQIPNSPGQTSNTFQQANLQAASAKHAELVNTYGQQSALADQQLQFNAQAAKAAPNAELGPMSEWLTSNRQRLIEMGVPQSLIPGSGTVTPTLELNKYLKNAALQGARSIYGNRMTQNEVELQTQEMSPSTHMTAAAVQSLVQQSNIQAQYQKQRAGDYNAYVNRGGDPMQFESWYAQNRPLTRFAAQQQTPTTPGRDGLTPLQRLQQRPDTLPQFKATFGWDPTR